MRYAIIITCFYITLLNVNSKVPQAVKYQGVARDIHGEVISNKDISLRISILKDSINGQNEFTETHETKTNKFGLFNLNIGIGEVKQGIFSNINWGTTEHFAKIELDINGGEDYELIGITELLSVPYSIQSASSDSANYSKESGTATYSKSSGTATYSLVAEKLLKKEKADYIDPAYPDGTDSLNWIYSELTLGTTITIPKDRNFFGLLIGYGKKDYKTENYDYDLFKINDEILGHEIYCIPAGSKITLHKKNAYTQTLPYIQGYTIPKTVDVVLEPLPYTIPLGKKLYGKVNWYDTPITRPTSGIMYNFTYLINGQQMKDSWNYIQFWQVYNSGTKLEIDPNNDIKYTDKILYVNGFLIDE